VQTTKVAQIAGGGRRRVNPGDCCPHILFDAVAKKLAYRKRGLAL
jgi:hypothetical protein